MSEPSSIPKRTETEIATARTAAEPSLVPVATLVLWLGCLAIGGLGFALPYARARLLENEPAPIVAELVNVELTRVPLSPPDITPSMPKLPEPPMSQPLVTPQAPSMLAVAAPSPRIAFAVPVPAPATMVEPKQASYRTPEVSSVAAPVVSSPATQPLTFGQGEGKQPAPEYPRQALRAGQEGTVVVRLTVDNNGRVMAAEAASPSPWPLLNDAALRVVRQRWRFPAGELRAYEVAIRFQLNK
jgi:TonB family protein